MVHVKICGLTSPEDATFAVRAGASAIGLNFVPASPRRVDLARAKEIVASVRALKQKVEIVGVVADLSVEAMRALMTDADLDCLQLHGSESPDTLTPLLPRAYKAVRIAGAADVEIARSYPGKHVLVDAFQEGVLGGTGRTFQWSLVKDLASERALTLAGGLTPENVEAAVREVRPFCVDVASGVERAPRAKDHAMVRAFIDAVRRA